MELPDEVAALDEVDESARALYIEKDGKFALDLSTTGKIKEFRTNNINLKTQLDEANTKLGAFKKTPEEIAAMETELADAKGNANNTGKKATELETQVADLSARFEASEQAKANATAALTKERAVNALSKAATDAGADPRMVDDVVNRAVADGWQAVGEMGSEIVRKQNDAVVLSTEESRAGQNQTTGEYFAALFAQKPGFKLPSGGGGSSNNTTPENKNVKYIPNDPEIMGQHAAGIADGSVVVKME